MGDKIVLQIGQPDTIPADSPLGRKTETVLRRTFTVSEIIPSEGLGGLSLSPSQQLPANAFVALESLQSMLDAEGELNMILVSATGNSHLVGDMLASLNPELVDYGLRFEEVADRAELPVNTRYFDLTSRRMLLDPLVLSAAAEAWPQHVQQPVFTYLANWINAGDRKIPYATIAAVDSTAGIGPLLDKTGQPIQLAADEIVLNDWAAADLDAEPGDEISITYFDPETTHGQVRESTAVFHLKAIVPLGGDKQVKTMANAARLTPELKGVTDQDSIDDWDPPFPFDAGRVRDRDEDYWDRYRATPKAFISLAAGRRLWSSRFGDTTSVRFVVPDHSLVNSPLVALRDKLAKTGLIRFQPIRQQALRAASGTTPFGLLFLGFSMFLIAAALMLVALFFRLSVEERAGEIGLMLAVGFSRRRVFQVLLLETLYVVNIGALVGVLGGISYSALMLAGLNSWWLEAVTTPFLKHYVTLGSIVIGYFCGAAVSTVVIAWSLWRWRNVSARQLMTGEGDDQAVRSSRHWRSWIGGIGLVLAGLLVPVALSLQAEMQAGICFLAGGLG
ncbi:MAG: ABC transporter permease, partial [Planctomycetales bacterium]